MTKNVLHESCLIIYATSFAIRCCSCSCCCCCFRLASWSKSDSRSFGWRRSWRCGNRRHAGFFGGLHQRGTTTGSTSTLDSRCRRHWLGGRGSGSDSRQCFRRSWRRCRWLGRLFFLFFLGGGCWSLLFGRFYLGSGFGRFRSSRRWRCCFFFGSFRLGGRFGGFVFFETCQGSFSQFRPCIRTCSSTGRSRRGILWIGWFFVFGGCYSRLERRWTFGFGSFRT